MGTKFRTMLAPIGASTGDGRRFAKGAIETAAVPFPFEWVRERQGGHDGAVTVGVVQETKLTTVDKAVADGWLSADAAKGLDGSLEGVFARGELLDHADRELMPELAEDVATVLTLIDAGTLGPSVDLDSFDGVPVMEGTDTPVTYEEMEAYWEEHGEEPKLELLITSGRVRAATLVSIPAFQETSRPLELIAEEATEGEAAAETSDVAALIASVATQTSLPPMTAFTAELDGPTPITWDQESGRVFGHIATWRTCHVGYEGVCITPPRDDEATEPAFSTFNRYAVETDEGLIWAGRLTVGGVHAGLNLNANQAIRVHDEKVVAAYVRAYSDEHGIAVAGTIEGDLDARDWAALNRRKVSGDWRETPNGLSLVEVLALSPGPRRHSEPGFPVAETFSRGGRQVALTAALGPEAGFGHRTATIDVEAAVRRALDADRAEQATRAETAAEREALAALVQPHIDAERAALVDALTREG